LLREEDAMDASEFWCRAFLVAMRGSYTEHGEWDNHGAPAAYAERAADAALAVAQRRGMLTGERATQRSTNQADVAQAVSNYLSRDAQPEFERVEFTSERDGDRFAIVVEAVGVFRVLAGDEAARLSTGETIRVKWSETSPPKPIEVWVERIGGAR
jgi:hypothetical protein